MSKCSTRNLGHRSVSDLVLLQDWVFHFARTEWTPGQPADLCTRRVSDIFCPELPMQSALRTTKRIRYPALPPRMFQNPVLMQNSELPVKFQGHSKHSNFPCRKL